MPDTALVRAALTLGPFGAGLVLWLARRPGYRANTGILFALLWNTVGLLAVNTVAVRAGWWSFHVEGGLFLGVPVDLLVGWSLLWTCLGTVALPRWHPAVVVAVAVLLGFWLDFLLMPRVEPVVVLHERWLVGEFIALAVCLAPGALFARWTADDRRLGARVTLHVIMFSAIMLWVIPGVILARLDDGGGWDAVRARPAWINALAAQIVLVPAVLGITAVQELFRRGGGTPVPIDPPPRLVTSGIYAYLRNPMQVSLCNVFIAWGLFLESWWVTAAAAMALVFGIGFGRWATNDELVRRFGRRYDAYRSLVRMWWPTWRPRVVEGAAPARLYLDLECRPCRQLAVWLDRRGPCGLEIVAAAEHPEPLRRMTYEAAEGDDAPPYACRGMIALARALEHVNFMWAFIGWTIRLPVVSTVAQLLADAVGGGPREAAAP